MKHSYTYKYSTALDYGMYHTWQVPNNLEQVARPTREIEMEISAWKNSKKCNIDISPIYLTDV
jgi:hypothetical protein